MASHCHSLFSPSHASSFSFSLARFPLPHPVLYPIFPAKRFFSFSPVRHTRSVAPFVVSQSRGIEEVDRTGDGHEKDEMEKYRGVGKIISTHGLKGEVKVSSTTDFPEIRFGKPGKRWLKMRDGPKEYIKEVNLTKGRNNPGQNNWILIFEGINSIEEADLIIGSTVLVRTEDRPELDEDEFYTPDLLGMKIILKETGEFVGTLWNVLHFEGEGNDILQVKPDASENSRIIMIPFVPEIVPDVDMVSREMRITPPKGLLELNLRSNSEAKKEKRLMEWKQKKKSQQRLFSAKKILNEMEQIHVLDALRLADKTSKIKLARQIASVDFKLFQHVVKNANESKEGISEDLEKSFSLLLKKGKEISRENFNKNENEDNDDKYIRELRTKGSEIIRSSKAAIVMIKNKTNQIGSESETGDEISDFLEGISEILNEEDSSTAPFVMVVKNHEVEKFENCLKENDYFGLDQNKVWILEEGRLPIYTNSSTPKMLFESPNILLEAPVGVGGVFKLLSRHKILDAFTQMGVEYVQICSLDDNSSIANPTFFGYVNSLNAEIGIKQFDNNNIGDESSFDMIISMKHIIKISGDVKKLGFSTILEKHTHVEKDSSGWIDVEPDSPNSYRIHLPVYGLLSTCSLDEMCVLNVSN